MRQRATIEGKPDADLRSTRLAGAAMRPATSTHSVRVNAAMTKIVCVGVAGISVEFSCCDGLPGDRPVPRRPLGEAVRPRTVVPRRCERAAGNVRNGGGHSGSQMTVAGPVGHKPARQKRATTLPARHHRADQAQFNEMIATLPPGPSSRSLGTRACDGSTGLRVPTCVTSPWPSATGSPAAQHPSPQDLEWQTPCQALNQRLVATAV